MFTHHGVREQKCLEQSTHLTILFSMLFFLFCSKTRLPARAPSIDSATTAFCYRLFFLFQKVRALGTIKTLSTPWHSSTVMPLLRKQPASLNSCRGRRYFRGFSNIDNQDLTPYCTNYNIDNDNNRNINEGHCSRCERDFPFSSSLFSVPAGSWSGCRDRNDGATISPSSVPRNEAVPQSGLPG